MRIQLSVAGPGAGIAMIVESLLTLKNESISVPSNDLCTSWPCLPRLIN
jgi:hypothetical protein